MYVRELFFILAFLWDNPSIKVKWWLTQDQLCDCEADIQAIEHIIKN